MPFTFIHEEVRFRATENMLEIFHKHQRDPEIAEARQAAYSSTYPSPRSAVYERPNEDVVDAVWWQEVQ